VIVAADETPLEFVLGEVSNGAVIAEDRVGIGDTLEAAIFQSVAIDWTGTTIETTFDGAQTVSIDSDSYDDGGIGFQGQGTQGIINSYANLVDAVTADTIRVKLYPPALGGAEDRPQDLTDLSTSLGLATSLAERGFDLRLALCCHREGRSLLARSNAQRDLRSLTT